MFQEEFQKIEKEYYSNKWRENKQALKEQLTSRPIILYGLGFFGAVIVKNFAENGIEVKCFCDSKKRGIDPETKLEILTPQELVEKYADANVVISVANPSTEKSVYDTILSLGFDGHRIFHFRDAYQFIRKSRVEQVSLTLEEFRNHLEGYERVYHFLSDNISRRIILETINSYLFHQLFTYDPPKESYFPEEFHLSTNEVFIDGGLYTGDTTEEFIRRTNNQYSRIIGFDIDKKNLLEAHRNLDAVPRMDIVEKGLWDCTTVKCAELGIMAGSNIKDSAADRVELTSLDEMFAETSLEEYPSFIKLDIEGSEKEALLGAKNIIKTAKPKLAVCVYHKPEDIYVLTELIHDINPQYKFFLRHYSPYIWDTVLYAY